ncbi:hypothetical protein KIW84_062346 [Lathyrus oleraceus]|uniref:DUF7745 domain-containing protein n=1 Tax=Pisum sativum TaxID=3888 RepID=A0A9D5A5Q3_PEA|nr:hypothetical protein KIW84_062346 [Pisum sativum]
MPDLQSLKVLQGLMPNSIQRKFTLKYGDFLLAPKLEEFGLYLDIPKDRKGPYMGMGQKVNPKELVVTLVIPTEDLLSHYKEDRDIQGLKRSYLEGEA